MLAYLALGGIILYLVAGAYLMAGDKVTAILIGMVSMGLFVFVVVANAAIAVAELLWRAYSYFFSAS